MLLRLKRRHVPFCITSIKFIVAKSKNKIIYFKNAVFTVFCLKIPYRMIKSRWLVGTDDLFTVETIHSSRVSKFWFFFEILDLMTI